MKLNFGVVRKFFSAVLQDCEGLLVIAALRKNPSKRVGYGRIIPLQITGPARQFISLV